MKTRRLLIFGLTVVLLLASVAAVPATASAAGCPPVYHRIARGENLFRIGLRYGVSVWQLQQWNGIANPNHIHAGTLLTIYPNYCPAPRPAPAPAAPIKTGPLVILPSTPPQPAPPPQPVCPQPVWPVGQPAHCADQRAVISWPLQNAHVSGMVTIRGNATHENFKFYKLEYGAGSNPASWSWFFGGEFPIWQGTLGALNTDVLPSGTYTIRVTVVDQSSNYPPPCQVTIVVR
jgi:LysM repeat protein